MEEVPEPIFNSGVSLKVTLTKSVAPELQPALSKADNTNVTSPAAISAAVGVYLGVRSFTPKLIPDVVDHEKLVGVPLVIDPFKENAPVEQTEKSAPAFTVIFPDIFNTTVSETELSQPLLDRMAVKRNIMGSPFRRSKLDGV